MHCLTEDENLVSLTKYSVPPTSDKLFSFSNALFNSEQLMRDDEVEPSLNRDDILDIAPDSDGVYFKVPKVIKEDD